MHQQEQQLFYNTNDASSSSPYARRTPISSHPGSRHPSLGAADFAQLQSDSLIEYLRHYQATQSAIGSIGGATSDRQQLDTMHEGVVMGVPNHFGPSHSSSGSPSPMPSGMMSPTKKLSKPMIEKRRRDRINRCLQTLKRLVIDSKRFPMNNASKSRVEKADILEVTVKYLENIENENVRQYQAGYTNCLNDVFQIIQELGNDNDKESEEKSLFKELSKRLKNLQAKNHEQLSSGANSTQTSSSSELNMRDLLEELNGIKSRSGSINDATGLEGSFSRNSIEDLMIADNYESDYDDRKPSVENLSQHSYHLQANAHSQHHNHAHKNYNNNNNNNNNNNKNSGMSFTTTNNNPAHQSSSVIRHTSDICSGKLKIEPSSPVEIPLNLSQHDDRTPMATPEAAKMPKRLSHIGSSPFLFDDSRLALGNERNSSSFEPLWRPWGFS